MKIFRRIAYHLGAAFDPRPPVRSEDTIMKQPVVIPQVGQALSRPDIAHAFVDSIWPALPADLTTAERSLLAFDAWDRFLGSLSVAGDRGVTRRG